jgi:hypothetical protein
MVLRNFIPTKLKNIKMISKMRSWLLKNKLAALGVLAGAIGGYLYWQQIGCDNGTCMITSTWHNSTAYGAVMGGLFFSLFQTDKKKENE